MGYLVSNLEHSTRKLKKNTMGEFKYGMFDCFGNFGVCLMAYCFPCVTIGQNAEALDMGSCMMCGCASLLPIANVYVLYMTRKLAREKVGAEGGLLTDLFWGICCGLCSQVQIKRELDPAAMG